MRSIRVRNYYRYAKSLTIGQVRSVKSRQMSLHLACPLAHALLASTLLANAMLARSLVGQELARAQSSTQRARVRAFARVRTRPRSCARVHARAH
eukprot:3531417-Pleurochrysis_carterae.AAC.1